MTHEVIMSGFGGQGVLSMGTLLAYAGMLGGKRVSWIPSYGPEMRGGTANCSVIISDRAVASPLVTEPTAVIAMNGPSLERFESWVRPGGVLVVNTSMVEARPRRLDISVIDVPANELALQLGSDKVTNMIALGAFLEVTRAVPFDLVVESLKKVLPAHRHSMIPLNRDALAKGGEVAARQFERRASC